MTTYDAGAVYEKKDADLGPIIYVYQCMHHIFFGMYIYDIEITYYYNCYWNIFCSVVIAERREYTASKNIVGT